MGKGRPVPHAAVPLISLFAFQTPSARGQGGGVAAIGIGWEVVGVGWGGRRGGEGRGGRVMV